MKKYCFEVKEITTKTKLVIVNAENLEEACCHMTAATSKNQIEFNEDLTDVNIEYEIADDCSKDDDTFDDEQFSEINMQHLNTNNN